MLFYGVVSSQTDEALELFLQHEQAEVFIAEVEEDEPERRRACGSSWLSSKRSETRRPRAGAHSLLTTVCLSCSRE